MPTVNFNESQLLPSFGYFEAQTACENLNKKNYGWNVTFAFNGGCTFSTDYPIGYFDFQFAVSKELKDYFRGYASQMGALAYAQGTGIHLAPGQDTSLAHEAWHVTQQK